MADCTPKEILPYLEGRKGSLIKARFLSKIDIRGPDECWEWQASCHTSGYGRFKIASHVTMMANRVSLVLHTGEDRTDLMALHRCDNPPCCNPHHLYWGTHSDNMQDMHRRGRYPDRDQSGVNNGAAKIDERQLALIVTRLQEGWNNKQIAEDLPIGHAMVSKIRLGHMWSEQTAELGWEPSSRLTRKAA